MNGTPSRQRPPIDKVRASREGHAYHEAWAARVALELVVPTTTLTALAVEGFSVEDAPDMSHAATEVADLVRYRGAVNVESASSIEVVQFKYSIAQALEPMRTADVRKTLMKFAEVDGDFVRRVGHERTEQAVRYELVTNRPFHASLMSAVYGLQRGLPLEGDAKVQADAIEAATALTPDVLKSFLERLTLTGGAGTHLDVKASVHRTLAVWGAASDSLARMRLGKLRDLVRGKAEAGGQYDNLIRCVDVLAALEVADERELFPAPEAFPSIDFTIDRPALEAIVAAVNEGSAPLLVHSAGGMGKTVLMQALARRFASEGEVVLFDGFGAGRWRDPTDARHLPKRALPHIANLLAGKGLCDPLLPSTSVEDLALAFRARLIQAVGALRNIASDTRVVLLLDAIDHAAQQASQTRTDSFAHTLLQSLSVSPIEGVAIVASCRTERLELARGEADCRSFPLPPFSPEETARLVRARDQGTTAVEIAALHGRSGGNPRVLDALLRAGRPYDAAALALKGGSSADLLEALLEKQITDARREASKRGMSEPEVDTMLAGLALMPPPVPVAELAAAQAKPEAAIESFVADLFPLLDRTPHGLIFRDEPTETLIRRRFTNDERSREAVVARLDARQRQSPYAARALPMVLTSLGRTAELVNLAFDERLPAVASSRVAQRGIRLSRLAAALLACAGENRADDLTRVLLEAARVAGGNERSDRFLQEHPDLVSISGDPEAARRLFESKSGWPGARHAALAVAQALADDTGEARRNARRAFDWLGWRSKLPDRADRPSTEEQDLFGPAYVEIHAGNEARAVLWLDHWSEDYSYRLLWRLVDLLERHAAVSAEARARRDRIVRLASRCRLRSRALPAAVLHHARVTADEERRLIRSLARCLAPSGPTPHDWHGQRKEAGLVDALLGAAMKAAQLGLETEARTILERIGLGRPGLWEFDSSWFHSVDVERRILWAGIRAALERRSPNLIDVAPREFITAIPARKHYATPEAFEAAVQALLVTPPKPSSTRRSKPRKTGLDHRQREEAARALTHRVRPLLPYANEVAALIHGDKDDAALGKALNHLAAVVAATQNYPYRNGPQHMARIGFDILLAAADALGAFSRDTADRLVDWLIQSSANQTDLWIHVVSVLSRRDETRDAALRLAQETGGLIQSNADIDTRISANGALGRAIWPASQVEAQAYFRRGLDIADAIGSDDFGKVAGLIEFARHFEGSTTLPADTVHTFARICELNIPAEAEKFDWVGMGKALSRIGGAEALAIVARLSNREKADLCWSLPPLLTALVEDGRVDAKIAAAIIGLDELAETWVWDLAHFAEVCLPKLQPAHREAVVGFLLLEIDRCYGASPPREPLERLLAVAKSHLPRTSAALARFAQLHGEADRVRSVAEGPPGGKTPGDELPEADGASRLEQEQSRQPQGEGEGEDVDTGDPEAIDAALEEERGHSDEPARHWCVPFLKRLQKRIKGSDDRLGFLRAVCEAEVPSLDDKLSVLRDDVGLWRKESAAIDDEIPKLAKQLAERHASELMGSDWESSYSLKRLIALSGRPGAELVPIIIRALGDRAIDVSGTAWLNLACVMSPFAGAGAIRSALERSLAISAPDLPGDLGDGPWRADIAATGSTAEIVAGLLWSCLGCPDAHRRWRAAHAVRRLADLGTTDVLHALVGRIDAHSAGPFQDRNLPFFFLHAKLWLLVALARMAVEHADLVLPFRPTLEAVAFDQEYPHVLMQHFAAMALRALALHLPDADRADLLDRLQRVNVSLFPQVDESTRRADFFSPVRPAGRPELDKPFHFDYDFAKYQIDGLAEVFACDHWEVVDACTDWIRRYSGDVDNMWDCPRTRGRSEAELEGWPGAATAGRDTWGGQLAWHALMLTAGGLLRRKPVAANTFSDELGGGRWRRWLDWQVLSRAEGLWLADGTDCFPAELHLPIVSKGSKAAVPAKPLELGGLAGLLKGLALGEELVIDGVWDSAEGIDVSVRSVLVDKGIAENVAFAVATEGPFHQWLPREEDFSRWVGPDVMASRFRPLTTSYEDRGRRLDEYDPYGSSAALRRARPTDAVAAALGVESADPFGRRWLDDGGVSVFRAEAWGASLGKGRRAKEEKGNRLFFRVDRMRALLSSTDQHLVLLIKAQRYLGDQGNSTLARRGGKKSDPFLTSTLIVTVCPIRGARPTRRIPGVIRAAVASLAEPQRQYFIARLEAILHCSTPSS